MATQAWRSDGVTEGVKVSTGRIQKVSNASPAKTLQEHLRFRITSWYDFSTTDEKGQSSVARVK